VVRLCKVSSSCLDEGEYDPQDFQSFSTCMTIILFEPLESESKFGLPRPKGFRISVTHEKTSRYPVAES
jgi:hypothetical protein